MISVRFVLQLLFAFSCILSLTWALPNQFENTKVIRVIDVNSAIAREDIGIRAKNTDTQAATDYYFYVPNVISKNAASISAFLRKQKTELQVTLEGSDANT
jgi:oligosaccharyltransferase complex subunit alpha (ribophorin I)